MSLVDATNPPAAPEVEAGLDDASLLLPRDLPRAATRILCGVLLATAVGVAAASTLVRIPEHVVAGASIVAVEGVVKLHAPCEANVVRVVSPGDRLTAGGELAFLQVPVRSDDCARDLPPGVSSESGSAGELLLHADGDVEVASVDALPGQRIARSAPLVTLLTGERRLRLDLVFRARDVGRLGVGARALLSTEAAPSTRTIPAAATVSWVSPIAESDGTFRASATLSLEVVRQARLDAGMRGEVHIVVGDQTVASIVSNRLR